MVVQCLSYPRLEPVVESHDMWVVHFLQHGKLIVYHLLIALDILLQYDLDGDFSLCAVGLPDDTICPSSQRASHAISRPRCFKRLSMIIFNVLMFFDSGAWLDKFGVRRRLVLLAEVETVKTGEESGEPTSYHSYQAGHEAG